MAGARAPPGARPRGLPIEDLPLFPLNTVLFPGGRLPLRIFEQRYMEMAKACLRDGTPFGVCLIRDGTEVGAPATPAEVGCIARIAEWDMAQLGVLEIRALGERRFRIVERRVQSDGLALASVHLLEEETYAEIEPHCADCVSLLERILAQPGAPVAPPYRMESALWVSSRLAEILPLPLEVKQALLELDDGRARLDRVNRLLAAISP